MNSKSAEMPLEQRQKISSLIESISMYQGALSNAVDELERMNCGILIIDSMKSTIRPPNGLGRYISCHVYKGIETMADILGVELVVPESLDGMPVPNQLGFTYNGILFRQIIDKEKYE